MVPSRRIEQLKGNYRHWENEVAMAKKALERAEYYREQARAALQTEQKKQGHSGLHAEGEHTP